MHHVLQAPERAAKDYGNSALHCFRKPGSKNFQNIFLSSATLYLCNIPPSLSEGDQKTLFYSSGSAVKGFKFFHRVCWMTADPDGFSGGGRAGAMTGTTTVWARTTTCGCPSPSPPSRPHHQGPACWKVLVTAFIIPENSHFKSS